MKEFKNSEENIITLEEIVKKLRDKNIAFFVGAGLSLGSGLPSWEDLVYFLCDKYGIKYEKVDSHDPNKGKNMQKLAQEVEKKAEKEAEKEADLSDKMVKLINECFEEKKPPCGYSIDMQRLLVKIAARTSGVIFTTNYDDLLEQAADKEQIRKKVYAYPHLFTDELKKFLYSEHSKSDGSLCIYKIHGTIDKGEKVILSNSSYNEAYSDQLKSLLTALSNNDLFFLGYSFTDSYLVTKFREANMGKGEWYTFYPALQGEAIDNEIIKSQNINVCNYIISDKSDNNQHNKNIKELFDYLSDKLDLIPPVDVGSQSDIERVRLDRTIKKIKLTKELGRDWCLKDLDAVEEIICCKENTRIPNQAFFKCSSLRIIRLEARITSIGEQAFDGCANLEKIYFGNRVNEFSSLELLGKGAFRNCAALVSMKFSDACRIDSVPYECFYGCISLTQVDFPKEIKKIGTNAFRSCESLQHFNFDNYPNLSEIGTGAFLGCALNEAYIVDSVTEIGGGAFQNCTKLRMVYISANLKKISNYCFSDCCKLEGLLGLKYSKVSSVGMYAFYECLRLRPSPFPESCNVEPTAFEGCSYQKEWMELLHS